MPIADSTSVLRVDLLCTGLDRIRRGYESFARECFDAYRDDPQLDFRLFKGSGAPGLREMALFCFTRESVMARFLALGLRRSPYHVEQWTFCRSYLRHCRNAGLPDVVFTSDANLANFLSRRRRRTGAGYRILFSNGGPVSPPFPEYDHVQQVAEPYLKEALEAGEPAGKHSLVPYGIRIPEALLRQDFPDRSQARTRLGLPVGGRIVLSVGNVSAIHKRMDHVVREVAAMPAGRRPYLVLLGHQDASTEEIRRLCEEKLGLSGFRIASCPHSEVGDYYAAADVFVLASLKEGFGRVFLEALMYGLPCVAHEHPVMRYVLGGAGCFVDMTMRGALAGLLTDQLSAPEERGKRCERNAYVAERFSWPSLRSLYRTMFLATAGPVC